MDGRTITVPLVWYPKLLDATEGQRNRWEIRGGGYGIHWPDLDEDLSTAGSYDVRPRRVSVNAQPPHDGDHAFSGFIPVINC